MVMNTGVYPARKITVVGACSMFLTVRIKDVVNFHRFYLVLITIRLLFRRLCSLHRCIKYVYQPLELMP
jgi:hypothetical protein